MTEELKKIVGENLALQSRLESAEKRCKEATERMEAAERRELEASCDCHKRIQELERLLTEVTRSNLRETHALYLRVSDLAGSSPVRGV